MSEAAAVVNVEETESVVLNLSFIYHICLVL